MMAFQQKEVSLKAAMDDRVNTSIHTIEGRMTNKNDHLYEFIRSRFFRTNRYTGTIPAFEFNLGHRHKGAGDRYMDGR